MGSDSIEKYGLPRQKTARNDKRDYKAIDQAAETESAISCVS
jgi:hypothetical protein